MSAICMHCARALLAGNIDVMMATYRHDRGAGQDEGGGIDPFDGETGLRGGVYVQVVVP